MGDPPEPPSTGAGVSIIDSCTNDNAIGPTPIRRLSTFEYYNSVRDALGTLVNRGDLPADEKLGSFISNVSSPLVRDNFDRYLFVAGEAAADVVADFPARSGCSSTADAACVESYLLTVGRELFHGTLEQADAGRISDMYTSLSSEATPDLAVETALTWMLTSPRFLFLVETGTGGDEVSPLTPSEVAGRLAAFLWRSVPDADLLAAADAGALDTPEGVRAQADAMLADARAAEVLKSFANQWLRIGSVPPDASALELQRAAQVGEVVAGVSSNAAMTFQDLMLMDISASASGELSQMYGDSPRNGLLLSGGFLASNASGTRPSQVKRGYVIRSSLLCTPIPPPTDPTAMQLPEASDGATEGEIFNAHSSTPECWGCHQLMDPIGSTFNSYGADGSFDPNSVEDTAGTVYGATDGEHPFADTQGLLDYLANDASAQQCFVLQAARFALGRGETAQDACSVQALAETFSAGDFSVRELLLQVASSQMFLNRNPVVAGGSCR